MNIPALLDELFRPVPEAGGIINVLSRFDKHRATTLGQIFDSTV
jgi:hypothetical protein